MGSDERLERRLEREKSARLEAEGIAELRMAELYSERSSLKKVVEKQTIELRKALELIEMTRVENSHDVLWETAEKLNKASHFEASEAIYSALTTLGVVSDAYSTSLWEIDLDTCIASPTMRWVAEGPLKDLVTPLVSHRISANLLDGIAEFDVGACLTFGPNEIDEILPDLANVVENPWSKSFGASLNIGLLDRQDRKVTVLTVFSQNESDRPSYLTYLLRGTMILLRQFISRIDLESQLSTLHEKQSEIHRAFMKSANKLMIASQQNLDEIVSEVMRETAILLDSPGITDWTVDYENQQYVLARLWRHTSVIHREVVKTADFGTRQFLDASRTEATTIQINPEIPTLAEPNRIAVVRGDALRPSGIIIAAKLDPVPWNVSQIEVLERLSTFMFAVEGRLGSDSRANAVLHSSPLPIVLRRPGDYTLLDCNSAFLKLIGRSSVDEVLGTPPNAVLYEKVEDVEEKFQSSAFWMFAEASRGDTGELPSIAVYRGPEGRPVLAEIRCMELTPVHASPFLLIHVSDITEQRQSNNKLQLYSEHLAFVAAHDDLTGLMNRRGILARISEIEEEFSHGALLVIDLDRFKNVNDSLGHATGNSLLQRVANRLEGNVRPGDAVGRLSGDEFVVVLRGPISESEVVEIGNVLIEKVGAASVVGGHRLYPSLSIGIAFWNDVVEATEAFLHADAAMYRAKQAGGRRLMMFDKSLQEEVETKQQLEAELRQALEQDEFCVHYQPVVSLLTGEIVGAEALVRWQHPRRGLLAAGTFIEAAEEMGFAADIGRRVLERACIDAAAWPQGSKPTSLSVNIAASQMADGHSLSEEVIRVLIESGFEASRLCLEVTESALIGDLELAVSILAELAVMGVRFSLDDFGTGYSSLAYLKRLKVDSLKIDKSFVSDLRTDPDSVKFVNSILGLADTLKLGVIAEGVETQEQAEMLRSLGCKKAQGWLYYKALPNHEIQELLRAQAAVL